MLIPARTYIHLVVRYTNCIMFYLAVMSKADVLLKIMIVRFVIAVEQLVGPVRLFYHDLA